MMDLIKAFSAERLMDMVKSRVEIKCNDDMAVRGYILGFTSALDNDDGTLSVTVQSDDLGYGIEISETDILEFKPL